MPELTCQSPLSRLTVRDSDDRIVPCHRVLGASGLGGFSAPGGVETEVALLRHEGAASLLL